MITLSNKIEIERTQASLIVPLNWH